MSQAVDVETECYVIFDEEDLMANVDKVNFVKIQCSHAGHCGNIETFFGGKGVRFWWDSPNKIGAGEVYFDKKFETKKRIALLVKAL